MAWFISRTVVPSSRLVGSASGFFLEGDDGESCPCTVLALSDALELLRPRSGAARGEDEDNVGITTTTTTTTPACLSAPAVLFRRRVHGLVRAVAKLPVKGSTRDLLLLLTDSGRVTVLTVSETQGFVELASVKVAEPGSDRYPGAPAMIAAHPDGTVFATLSGDGRMKVTAVEVDEGDDDEGGSGAFSVRLSEPLELHHEAPFNPAISPTGLLFRPRREEEEDDGKQQQEKQNNKKLHERQQQQQQQQRPPPRFPRQLRLSVVISAASADSGLRDLCDDGRDTDFRGPWCLSLDRVDLDPESPALGPGHNWASFHRLLPPPRPPPRGAAAAAAAEQRPPIDHVVAVAFSSPGGSSGSGGVGGVGGGGGVGPASSSPRPASAAAAGLAYLLVDRDGAVSASRPEALAAAADAAAAADGDLRAPPLALGGGRVTATRLSETGSPGSFVLWLATERGAVRRVGVDLVLRHSALFEPAGDGTSPVLVPSTVLRELPPARLGRTGALAAAAPPVVALVPLPCPGRGRFGDGSALVWPRGGRAEVVFAARQHAPDDDGSLAAVPPRAPLPFRRVLGPIVDMDSTATRRAAAAEGAGGSSCYPGAVLVTRLESDGGGDAERLSFCSSSAASVTPGAAATTLVSTSGAGSAPGVGGLWSVAVPKGRSGSGNGGSGDSGGGGVVMVSFASASRALAGGGASSTSPSSSSPSSSSPPSSSPSSLVDATAALGAAADESTLAFGEVFREEGGVVAAHATTFRVRLCDAARAARVAAAFSDSASSSPSSPPLPPILARDFLAPPGSSISAAATSGAAGGLVLLSTTARRGVTLLALLARASAPPRREDEPEVLPSSAEEQQLPFGLEVAAELALPHEASCLSLQQRGGASGRARATPTFELLALVGTYRPGVSLLGVSVSRGAGGAVAARVAPLAELAPPPPPPPRELGPLLGLDAAAAATAAVRKQRRESSPREGAAAASPPPPPREMLLGREARELAGAAELAAELALPEPAPPNVPESVMLVLAPPPDSGSDSEEEGGTAAPTAHALVGWRCGALSHAAAVRGEQPGSPSPAAAGSSSPPRSPWRLEQLTHVTLGSLPVSLRPAPPGLLPQPPSQGAAPGGKGRGGGREPRAVAVAVAVGGHAAVVSLLDGGGGGSPAGRLPLPARVSRLNLWGSGAAALHAVALWSGAAGGGGDDDEEEEEEEEEREPKARPPPPLSPPLPCLLVAGADASLSLVAVSPDLSPLRLLLLRGEAPRRPSRFSHVAALSFSDGGGGGGGGGEEGGSPAPPPPPLPAVVIAAACDDAVVLADALSGEVLLRHPVGRGETVSALAAWSFGGGGSGGGAELLAAGSAAEARLRACLVSATATAPAGTALAGGDEDERGARLPPRGRTMRQHQRRQGLAAALESASEEEEEEEEEGEGEAAAGPVTRRRSAAEAAAAAVAATAATATAPVTGAPEEEEMLEEEEEQGQGEEAALDDDDDGEELPPVASPLRPPFSPPSSRPPSPPPPPPKSCTSSSSKRKGNPVCWLAFSSNDETQEGGMGRIRVLAIERVPGKAGATRGEEQEQEHEQQEQEQGKSLISSHSWRATVVAHVRCPRERIHALATLPDGGLAAAVSSRRLVLLDVAAPPATAAFGRAAVAAALGAAAAAARMGTAAAAGAARAPTSRPLLSAGGGDRSRRPPPPGVRGSLRARAVCRLRAGGDSSASALSLRVLPATSTAAAEEPVSSSSSALGSVTSVIALADGGNGPRRGGGGWSGGGGGGGVGVSLFAVMAGPPPQGHDAGGASPRRGLLRPIAACSTPWAASAAVPVAWSGSSSGSGSSGSGVPGGSSTSFLQDFGAVGGDALGGRLFALAPPPPLFRDGGRPAAVAAGAAPAAVNPERSLADAAVGRMGGGSRVTCAVALRFDDGGDEGDDGDGRTGPEGAGDDPLSSKKRRREGLFLPSLEQQQQRQLQQQKRLKSSRRRHPTWLFGNDAGSLLAVRQVPRELGAALLLIQAALESTGSSSSSGGGGGGGGGGEEGAAAAPPPLAVPPSLKSPSISPLAPQTTESKLPQQRRPFCPPWAQIVADAAGREAAAAVLAAHAAAMETEAEAEEEGQGAAGRGGGEEALAAAAEAAVAAASMPPLSPRGVSTALAAAVAAVAGGNGSGTANNNAPAAALAPAPASSAEAPAPFPPLALPAPEGLDDPRHRACDEAAMRVAMRAFESAKAATLAAIADGTHPLAERALCSSSSASLSSFPSSPRSPSLPPPLSSPPQFLDGDSLAALFELPIRRRREVLDRLGSGGAVVAALALAAAGGGNRQLAAAALRAAADAERAAEVLWGALEGLL